MVLLWGILSDDPLMAVRAALERQRARYLFLDQQAVLETALEFSVAREVHGTLRTRGGSISLNAIAAAYLRPYDSRRMRVVERAGRASSEWNHALNLEDGLVCWADLTLALVVNRPAAMASNNSKPYQAQLISESAFGLPDTLVTTEPEAALAFWERHGTVVYKSVSGIRSIVSRLTAKRRDHLRDIVSCPTLFQEYIPGIDYRVHVVGQQIFACEVASQADDYRYAVAQGHSIEVRPVTLPDDAAERCRNLAAALKLAVAGIDLRRTAAGAWYCFEVNPSPGFTFYQEAANQPIDDAIASFLVHGGCR